MAAFSSARLKKVRLRSVARIHLWANKTPASALALSLGFRTSAGDHHRAVEACQIGIAPIDFGLIATRVRDATEQVIRYKDGGTAAIEFQPPDVQSDPLGQCLARRGFGKKIPTGSEYPDKKLDRDQFPCLRVDERKPLCLE